MIIKGLATDTFHIKNAWITVHEKTLRAINCLKLFVHLRKFIWIYKIYSRTYLFSYYINKSPCARTANSLTIYQTCRFRYNFFFCIYGNVKILCSGKLPARMFCSKTYLQSQNSATTNHRAKAARIHRINFAFVVRRGLWNRGNGHILYLSLFFAFLSAQLPPIKPIQFKLRF